MSIIECLIALLAGSGVFIAGMKYMSDGLERLSGPSMKKMLGKISNNRFVGVGIGAGVTALIQSSAATTVMVIGFVNAGVMNLVQAAPIIMGANIGTTVTGLLVSLSSLETIDINLWMSFLAFIGIVLMFFKSDKIKNIGSICAGLGLIFIGLDLMSNSFGGDDNVLKQAITNLFTYIDFPLLLILLGIIFTALMQSSSAMTGLVIVMASQGAISVESALFIVIGTNVGTCITSLLATIGTTTNAKRTGFLHLFIKSIGALLFTIIVWIFKDLIVQGLAAIVSLKAMQIALFHLIFNVVTTFVLLPFTKFIVQIVERFIKDNNKENEHLQVKYIDERLLRTPSIATVQVKKEIENMALLSKENLERGITDLLNNNCDDFAEIAKKEDLIDFLNGEITRFLIDLTPHLNSHEERMIGSYFHVVNDIERIGDHAQNFADVSKEMLEKGISFSDEARKELKLMKDTITEMFDIAMSAFDNLSDKDLARLDELEAKTDDLKDELTISHYERLSKASCTMELGAYYTSVIAGIERVGDHLVNIGYSVTNPTGDQK